MLFVNRWAVCRFHFSLSATWHTYRGRASGALMPACVSIIIRQLTGAPIHHKTHRRAVYCANRLPFLSCLYKYDCCHDIRKTTMSFVKAKCAALEIKRGSVRWERNAGFCLFASSLEEKEKDEDWSRDVGFLPLTYHTQSFSGYKRN